MEQAAGLAEVFLDAGQDLEGMILRSRMPIEPLSWLLRSMELAREWKMERLLQECMNDLVGSAAQDGLARQDALYAVNQRLSTEYASMNERRSFFGRVKDTLTMRGRRIERERQNTEVK